MRHSKSTTSIIVPLQQHSYHTARGLIEYDLLDRYYTSVYYKNKGIYRILSLVLPHDILLRMHKKCDPKITPFVYNVSETLGLFFLYALRSRYLQKYYPKIRNILIKRAAIKASKDIIKRKVNYAWSFDTMAIYGFQYLNRKAPDVIKILDMASTTVAKIKEIIDDEYQKQHPFVRTLNRHINLYTKERCSLYTEEIKCSDWFLVPSGFVKNSLVELGVNPNRILWLPHGVDSSSFSAKPDSYVPNNKLRFLFVGRMETAKGIYYIAEAFRRMQSENIELVLVGEDFGQREELEKYSKNIKVLGRKQRGEMPEIYANSDVFILSSLWEGSSLSLLEALACGLPVIASRYSCAPELVEDYKEGFVIEPREIDQIIDRVKWFISNKNKIFKMGKNARKKAEEYSWEKYYENCGKIITEITNSCTQK